MTISHTTPPVVDREALDAKFGAMPEILGELVEVLIQDLPQRLSQLRAGVADGDATQVFQCAHAIKGAVGNFEAHQATATALELEMMGRGGDLAQSAEVLARLESELELLLAELRRITRDTPAG